MKDFVIGAVLALVVAAAFYLPPVLLWWSAR